MLCFGPILGRYRLTLTKPNHHPTTIFLGVTQPQPGSGGTWIGRRVEICAQESWERSINLPRFLCHSDDSWRWWRKRTSDLDRFPPRFLYNGPSHFFWPCHFCRFCPDGFFSTINKKRDSLAPLSSLTWNWKDLPFSIGNTLHKFTWVDFPAIASWWFQPIWKILVKLDYFPK